MEPAAHFRGEMDEAVVQAFKGLSSEVGQVRHDISVLRDEFKGHIEDDRRDIGTIRDECSDLKSQQDKWIGAVQLVGWVLGIGVPAILGVLIAHVAKHW